MLIQHLAEGIVRKGHECNVVTCLLPGTKRYEEFNGVRIHRVPVPRFADRYFFTLLSLTTVLTVAQRADIIHTATYNGALTAWIASKVIGKPIVMLPYEVLGRLWLKLGLNRISAIAYMLFEKLILTLPYNAYSCDSISTMDALVRYGIPRERTFLAYPGIDYDLFNPDKVDGRRKIRDELGIGNETFLYMYTGRPGVLKGVEYLIRAVPLIRQRIPDSRLLLLLSRKPYKKYTETLRLLSKLRGQDIILHETVEREELPLFLQASDCVIIPSLNEGFGFTCVEAYTMGRPVVVTKAGSLPEVVSGRYVIVSPKSPDAIADGVEKIYKGQYTASEIKRFLWKDTIEKHIEVYERLLAKGTGG